MNYINFSQIMFFELNLLHDFDFSDSMTLRLHEFMTSVTSTSVISCIAWMMFLKHESCSEILYIVERLNILMIKIRVLIKGTTFDEYEFEICLFDAEDLSSTYFLNEDEWSLLIRFKKNISFEKNFRINSFTSVN